MRLIASILLLLGTTTVGAVTIDFEDYTGPSGTTAVPAQSNGFNFTGAGTTTPIAWALNLAGTAGWSLAFCPGCTVTMTADSGAAFDLLSLDLLNTGGNPIGFIGTYTAGGTVQTSLNASGSDFINFSFDGQWAGLSSLEIIGDFSSLGTGIDNIEVNVVPIPAAAWLFASALGLLGWQRAAKSLL